MTSPNMPIRQPLDLRAIALVLMLCVMWGVQQVAMKSVVADVPPVMQLAVRFAGAALFFGPLVAMREGRRAFADGTLWSGLLLGVMFSLEFVFAGSALIHTTASHTIVLLYSAPIFTALGLQFLPEERLDRVQWMGIMLAFSGIVVVFAGPGRRAVAEFLAGDLLALLGGAAWGLSNVVLRRGRVGGAVTAKTVLYQVGVAAPVLYAFASVTGQTRLVPSEAALLALAFQTLFISIFSYLVWFWLLRHYLTSRLMLLSLMTPLFGILFGALLLRDPIEPRFALGSFLVLAGILVVNGQLLRSPAA
ncbi:MAG: DMT family transporter [Pseudomonadota bacterium]|nr:DMT family transporter [Pseudomonadota bacterium]